MYPFKYHLRRHIILGEWERTARVAPKAASNRYPYLAYCSCRAQMFKYYKLLRRHIIYTEGKSGLETVSSFYYLFLNPYATLCILLNTICADISF